MSEKKEPIKVSLKIAIALILVLLITIAILSMYFLNKSNNLKTPDVNQLAKNEIVAEKQENAEDYGSMDYLDVELLKENNNKENMIFSPLSIKYAIAMLAEGADKNTKAQIENILKDNKLTKYENIENTLSLANAVFIKDSYKNEVKEDFVDSLLEKYNAEFRFDEFENAVNINNWIKEKTFGILKNVLDDEDVKKQDLEMILVNALAIDMEWKEKFDGEDTYGKDFYTMDGTTKTVAMMQQETTSKDIKYYLDDQVTAVLLDLEKYGGSQLEFIAIMPKEKSLDKYIEDFSAKEFDEIVDKMEPASKPKKGINLLIPRFDYDYQIPLKENLQKLGMVDAFNKVMADFSKMSDTKLFIEDAIHKADIEFTEKGVKAAAVTLMMMLDGAMLEEEKPIEVVVDNPFMYVIRDKDTDEIWFMGTVYEPCEWSTVKSEYQYR